MSNQFELTATIEKIIEFKLSQVGVPVLTVLLKHESIQVENEQKRQVILNIVAKLIGKNALIYNHRLNVRIFARGFLQTTKLGFKNIVFHVNEITEIGN